MKTSTRALTMWNLRGGNLRAQNSPPRPIRLPALLHLPPQLHPSCVDHQKLYQSLTWRPEELMEGPALSTEVSPAQRIYRGTQIIGPRRRKLAESCCKHQICTPQKSITTHRLGLNHQRTQGHETSNAYFRAALHATRDRMPTSLTPRWLVATKPSLICARGWETVLMPEAISSCT